jgi:hypothetical protein
VALADVEDILKHDYKDLTTLLNDKGSPVAAQIDRKTDTIHGDYAVIAMEVGREFGIGSRLEDEVLPQGESVAPVQAWVKVKRIYGAYRIGVPEIAAMETDAGAFTRAQPRRIRNLKNGCTREYSRQVWGNGSGRLAQCGTTSNSTTLVLAATTAEQSLINFAEGMRVDIGTDANPQVVASNRKVISVDEDNATLVIEGPAVTTTSSHFVYRQGAGGVPQTATQRELTGLERHVDDDTTDQNLDPATQWNWKALVLDAGGSLRPPSENLLETGSMRLENRSDAMLDAWVCGDEVYRACVNSLKGRQRDVNRLELKGGHAAIDFTFGARSAPLMNDKDATPVFPNSLLGLEWASFTMNVQRDWQWEQMDGNVLRMAKDGTHNLEAIYYTFRELSVSERNHNLRIDDIEGA